MKLLLDFLPLLLFFATYRYAKGHLDGATAFVNDHFGFMVSGGVVAPDEAPVLLATLVIIVASVVQIAVLKARGQKVDTMLWVVLALVTVLGGATIWFHSTAFLKWKPTALSWGMAGAFWAARAVFRKNLLQSMMGGQIRLPDPVWWRLNTVWIAFFGAMGAINLAVAYSVSFDTWVDFKTFGVPGLTLLFTLAQGVYMSRHIDEDPPAPAVAAKEPL